MVTTDIRATHPLPQPCQTKSASCQPFAMSDQHSPCRSRARDWLAMATWQQFADAAPDLAAAVRARLTATKHHVLATLRKDGAPRVSGTEVDLTEDGHLRLGSMSEALKGKDLRRDGRFALHANPGDGSMDDGDAKLSQCPGHVARVIAEERPGDDGPASRQGSDRQRPVGIALGARQADTARHRSGDGLNGNGGRKREPLLLTSSLVRG